MRPLSEELCLLWRRWSLDAPNWGLLPTAVLPPYQPDLLLAEWGAITGVFPVTLRSICARVTVHPYLARPLNPQAATHRAALRAGALCSEAATRRLTARRGLC